MDIICARCGVHLSSAEDARRHSCRYKDIPADAPLHWEAQPEHEQPECSEVSVEQWQDIVEMMKSTAPTKKTTEEIEQVSQNFVSGADYRRVRKLDNLLQTARIRYYNFFKATVNAIGIAWIGACIFFLIWWLL